MRTGVDAAVEAWFSRELPLKAGDGIIVALSGGADSMALLHVLCKLRSQYALSLLAAHVHHGLRGEEADRDEAFVRRQCQARNIPLEILHAHVDREALPGEGTEEAGRRIRYGFFKRLQQQYGYVYVATAHTASDNLETVLLHLTRGSALHGLCGIPPVNGAVIRPLLDCSRKDIEAYCAAENIPFVTDSTNVEDSYSRNRIRRHVVPQLTMLNPQVTAACRRLTARVREDDRLLGEMTADLLKKAQIGNHIFSTEILSSAPPALLHRALKQIADAVGADCEDRHIVLAERFLREKGGAVQLPDGAELRISDGKLIARRIGQTETVLPFCMPLEIGASYEIAGEIYTAMCFPREFLEEKRKVYKNVLNFALDYDKITGDLIIRQRKAGDAFHPVGGVGKTLKKFLNEKAVAAEKRPKIPLLCDEKGIVLVTGFSCDDRVKLDDSTRRVLLFYTAEMY